MVLRFYLVNVFFAGFLLCVNFVIDIFFIVFFPLVLTGHVLACEPGVSLFSS